MQISLKKKSFRRLFWHLGPNQVLASVARDGIVVPRGQEPQLHRVPRISWAETTVGPHLLRCQPHVTTRFD